jgi:hypothetical protein
VGWYKLQKPTGLVQFTIEAGAVNAFVLGSKPNAPAVQKWSTGPVRSAYITIAPTSEFSISAGQIGSLEGYESALDWKNFNMLLTSLWDVENAQSVGVSATYAHGPFTGKIAFGDGFDTNVWNCLQLLGSYDINKDNNIMLFGATNPGSTDLGARFYGNATTPYRRFGGRRAPGEFTRHRRLLHLQGWKSDPGTGGAIRLVNEKHQRWPD